VVVGLFIFKKRRGVEDLHALHSAGPQSKTKRIISYCDGRINCSRRKQKLTKKIGFTMIDYPVSMTSKIVCKET
jgi:hypothetical protein